MQAYLSDIKANSWVSCEALSFQRVPPCTHHVPPCTPHIAHRCRPTFRLSRKRCEARNVFTVSARERERSVHSDTGAGTSDSIHSKQVSERFRTRLLVPSSSSSPSTAPSLLTSSSASDEDPTLHRLFTSMDEITALIPRGGYRGHKPEMADVRDFLAAKGLGEAFGQVVGGGQFS